ncbi:hypothetical protein G6F59_015433 [Rhizopus arrhizus]|nr:hypothetical protein G6F59_015433 [Rhizopus arrhizus]
MCRRCSWPWPGIGWWPRPSPAQDRRWRGRSCRPSRWTEGDHALGPSTAAGTSAPARNAAAAARPPSHLCAAHAVRAVRRHPADRDAAGGVELQQQPGTAAGTAAGRRGACQCHRRAPAAFRCTGRCDLGRTGCGRATAAPARGPVAA